MGPMGPGSSGEIPGGFLALLAVIIVVGLVGVAVVTLRRRRDQDLANRRLIERIRAVVRKQLDAVADDILDLEDSVRVAGNDQALAHYRTATIAYGAIITEFETADSAQDLTNLASRLDTAIWQLDAAEAILNGDPPPLQPQARSLSPSQPTDRSSLRSDRRSAVGVIELVTEMLETRPRPAGPSRGRGRHRSRRRHC